MNYDEINIEKLRRDLIDYFGSASFNGFPIAAMELISVENASDEKLINIAINNNFDLNEYVKQNKKIL